MPSLYPIPTLQILFHINLLYFFLSIGRLPSDFFDKGPPRPTIDSGGEEEEEEGGVELPSSTASETFPTGQRVGEVGGGGMGIQMERN